MSKKDETLRSVLDSEEKTSQWVTIVIALIVGLITLGTVFSLFLLTAVEMILIYWHVSLAVFLFVWRRGRVSRRGICLVGLCESGKTLIFSQLIYKKAVESFTSMKENVGVLQIENKVLRDYLSPVILTNTKCILYL
jgi:signal recognition particle receptor subunit beta